MCFPAARLPVPFFFLNIGWRFFFSGIRYKYTGGYSMQVQNFFFFTEKQWKSGTLIACRCTNLSDLMFDGLRVIPPITPAAETYSQKKIRRKKLKALKLNVCWLVQCIHLKRLITIPQTAGACPNCSVPSTKKRLNQTLWTPVGVFKAFKDQKNH